MKGVKNFEATTVLIPTFTQASPLQKDKATKEDNSSTSTSTEHRGKKERKTFFPKSRFPLSLFPFCVEHTHAIHREHTKTRSVLDAQGNCLVSRSSPTHQAKKR